MPPLLLSLIAIIVVFVTVIYLGIRIVSVVVGKTITSRLRAIEQIINEHKVPAAWIAPFHKQLARRGDTAEQERIGARAQQHCLDKLDDLIQYTKDFKLTDTDETQRLMLAVLQEQRDAWAMQTPQAWLENTLTPSDENESA